MPLPILVVNGPNLNMLGAREPSIYGKISLPEIEERLQLKAKALGVEVECFQSNEEGVLVTRLQEAVSNASGVIINAGAYTHTSVAILDALSLLTQPIIEVHLSNIYRRESFRHKSYVSMIARGIICGFGADGYVMALEAMKGLQTA